MAKSVIDYYETATVTCSNCNSVYTLGLTVEKLEVEICGNCHPFYTGQETLIDTAGRIEKFQARLAKFEEAGRKGKKDRTKKRKSIQTLADLNLGDSSNQTDSVTVAGEEPLSGQKDEGKTLPVAELPANEKPAEPSEVEEKVEDLKQEQAEANKTEKTVNGK